MEKVIITGGSGFIGTNLVQYYLDRNVKVLNYDIKAPINKLHSIYWRHVDILDGNALLKAVHDFNPDYIFHMAARTDLDGDRIEEYAANTQGVSNLVKAAKSASNLKRVVFASSMLVCELGYRPTNEFDYKPSTPYGESKVASEKIVRSEAGNAFPWLIVRPTSIWGPWFDVPYKNFFTAVMKGHYFHPKGLEVKRSYGFVLNAVHELIKFASCQKELVHSKTFYLADYEPIELKSWGVMIQKAFNSREIKDLPVTVFVIAAKIGDVLKNMGFSNPPMTTFRLTNMQTDAVFNMKEVQELCGDLPYSVSSGVKDTVNWMKQHSA